MSERALPPARHETRDIAFRPMLIAAGLMAFALALVVLGVRWMYPHVTTDVVIAGRTPNYPAPQLQTDPSGDMARFYLGEMQQLNGTGWVDRAQGLVHIPIEDAMRQVVQRGIPDWPAPPAGAAR